MKLNLFEPITDKNDLAWLLRTLPKIMVERYEKGATLMCVRINGKTSLTVAKVAIKTSQKGWLTYTFYSKYK